MDPRLPPRPETFARLIKGAALFPPRSRLRRRRLENEKHESCFAGTTFGRESVGANVSAKGRAGSMQIYAGSESPANPPSSSTQTTTGTTRSAIGLSDTRADDSPLPLAHER